ncbi:MULTISPECIES: hypothetical protein [Rhodococcus]|uniref:hypothetical protein n=1 Tax=Rhodococcus TaxID=1827 RepID=UPI001E3A4124|nr:hypothetical protein [Rhodococcus pyridinivorans]MCD2115661.1 hypothetical protein [Rhodococcus pyridinivorans]MCZ4624118.1 hypothetical protein [Rhodococcus pyridinivorans]MCZ4645330.1 hypothetical protein [Rhodococcus pyridinivorans]MDJ0481901.1 hypothetical protein [Rhodococcus pyridinivorans]MDV7251434.1 hypothetical protein [Rhodococcus pyridinivorans]
MESPAPQDVGYLLGASRSTKVWASVEDSILLIGPPRSGKGLHVVINAILDAPGAVVTTSTRPDNLTATLRTGITMLRSAPPIVTDLRAWPTRADAAQLGRDRYELEALLRRRPAS